VVTLKKFDKPCNEAVGKDERNIPQESRLGKKDLVWAFSVILKDTRN
jgi:hypothetical protein